MSVGIHAFVSHPTHPLICGFCGREENNYGYHGKPEPTAPTACPVCTAEYCREGCRCMCHVSKATEHKPDWKQLYEGVIVERDIMEQKAIGLQADLNYERMENYKLDKQIGELGSEVERLRKESGK